MPPACTSAILNVVLLITLLLALGLSSTGFGLYASNYGVGKVCPLNVSLLLNGLGGNSKMCSTSLAGYIIATICIGVVTLMEFNRLVYGYAVNTVGKIIQILLLPISGVLLLISGIIIEVGWSQACKNAIDAGTLPCDTDSLLFNSQQIFGSAVCAFLGMIFVIIATIITIVNAILSRNASEEEKPY